MKKAPGKVLISDHQTKLFRLQFSTSDGHRQEKRDKMAEETPDVVVQTARFTPDLFIIPAPVMLDKDLQPLDTKVYAVVYWFERMKDGYCRASNDTISKIVNSSSNGVNNSLGRLREKEYVECTYDNNNHRVSIITLPQSRQGGTSDQVGGGTSNDEHIQKRLYTEKKYSPDVLRNIERLHTHYLISFLIEPHVWNYASEEERTKLVDEARNKYRLTPKRKEKIAARLADFDYDTCLRAIKNCAESDFHRGENDRKWKADLEFIFRNVEKTEEWANK